MPTNSCLLLGSPEAAHSYPTASLRLAVCHACGFITNLDFNPSLTRYSTEYEETQGFSPHFRAFAERLAKRWIERHGIHGKHVVEIGCGKGEFLASLCELADNRGTGIDPSYVPGRLETPALERLTFHQGLFDETYGPLDADVVVCRHTLEHIGPVAQFLRHVREALQGRDDVVVLFELPDTVRVLREVAFWDIYYEHCSYFTPGSLARLFRREGFDVTHLERDYDDQYLILDALPASSRGAAVSAPLAIEEPPDVTVEEAREFASRFAEDLSRRRAHVSGLLADGRRPVIWGAGSKGVAWLTTLDVREAVPYAVDINPHKQGKFMAGTGQQIVAPSFLMEYRPDTVFVMNPVYRDEIRMTLDRLGVDAELVDA